MMQQFRKLTIIFMCLFGQVSLADPWFTGPLLAPAGHTVAKGHTNLELYGLDVDTDGIYDSSGELVKIPLFRSLLSNPVLTYGLTDWLDVQWTIPYVYNTTQSAHSSRLTDVSLALGFQIIEQKNNSKLPDLRILVQETFPTGRFENLNPALLGTDATGLGSYQTRIGLDFQFLREVNAHYLRTRLIVSYLHSNPVTVHGLSSYGGSLETQGKISVGHEYDADLAFEYTLTQNWVAVLEGTLSNGNGSRFDGNLTIANIAGPDTRIGFGNFYETALAPALEYNFNENVGLIGGVWFPLSGQGTSHYMAYVLALNAYW